VVVVEVVAWDCNHTAAAKEKFAPQQGGLPLSFIYIYIYIYIYL
jgi:hypothetical protein